MVRRKRCRWSNSTFKIMSGNSPSSPWRMNISARRPTSFTEYRVYRMKSGLPSARSKRDISRVFYVRNAAAVTYTHILCDSFRTPFSFLPHSSRTRDKNLRSFSARINCANLKTCGKRVSCVASPFSFANTRAICFIRIVCQLFSYYTFLLFDARINNDRNSGQYNKIRGNNICEYFYRKLRSLSRKIYTR